MKLALGKHQKGVVAPEQEIDEIVQPLLNTKLFLFLSFFLNLISLGFISFSLLYFLPITFLFDFFQPPLEVPLDDGLAQLPHFLIPVCDILVDSTDDPELADVDVMEQTGSLLPVVGADKIKQHSLPAQDAPG